MTINFKLFGDHFDGKFTLFWCKVEREGYSVDIHFSADQMNDAAQYDDPFEAALPLMNMFNECGYTLLQSVTIENGDGSTEELELVNKYDGITHEGYEEFFQNLEFEITDNDNVKLATYDEALSNPDGTRFSMYEFIINTEPNDSKPEEIVENLKSIFNQNNGPSESQEYGGPPGVEDDPRFK